MAQDQTALCGFGPGTLIETLEGPLPIEWLSSADALITRGGAVRGQHRVIRIDGPCPTMEVEPSEFAAAEEAHRLVTTGQQSLLLEGDDLALHFGFSKAFCRVAHLSAHPAVSTSTSEAEHLFALVTERPTAVRANGLWVESNSRLPNDLPAYPRLEAWEVAFLMQARGEWKQTAFSAVA